MAKYFSRWESPDTHPPTNWLPAFSNLSVHHSWHCPICTKADRCNLQRRYSASCDMSHCTFPYGMSTKMLRWHTKRCKKNHMQDWIQSQGISCRSGHIGQNLKRGRLPARMFVLPIRWWTMARKGHIYIF